MNDARYPWVILVPRRAGLVEIGDLDAAERAALMEEITRVAGVLGALAGGREDQLRRARQHRCQLHAHASAVAAATPRGRVRYGRGAAVPYEAPALRARLSQLAEALTVA